MSNTRTKKYLKLLMVIGLIALAAGGAGTFASFSAQTTNEKNTFATGSLLLGNETNKSGTFCMSDKGAGNANENCSAFVTVDTQEPGSSASGTVTVKNEGTLDASKLTLYAPGEEDCKDTQVAELETLNPVTGSPLCKAVLMYVQETTGGNNYCWAGSGVGTAQCTAPISVTLSEGLSTGGEITSLPVNALNGNVASGDSISVTSGSKKQTFTASANAYIGATSISVSKVTPNFAYPETSTVTDTTTLGTLNSDKTHTISAFDVSHNNEEGKLELLPLKANGEKKTAAEAEAAKGELPVGQTRTFTVGLYLPKTEESQNELQDLKSTFGLTWHIDQ